MNRREFLKLGGAGLAGAALLGSAACGGGSSGSGDLIFAMGTDTSGTLNKLVDKFNKQSKDFKVQYREMPTDSGAYFDKLRTQFQAGGGDIDIIGADVIWPAEFAANGWILDVTDRFPKSDQEKFLPGPIQSLMYDGKIYGVPWFTDAGLLYYRADLLEKSGYSEPPKTWSELEEMGMKTAQDQGIDNAFVFQGDQYEGGVCNGCEYIWTNGGNILDPADPNKVVIDSPEAAAGLSVEQGLVQDGIAPQAVATYTETETDPAFLGNKAVFARNWPYMYGLAGTSGLPRRQARADRCRSRAARRRPDPARQRARRMEHAHQLPIGHAGRSVGVHRVDHRPRATEVAFSGGRLPANLELSLLGQGDQGHAAGRRAGRGGAQERQVAPGLTLLLGHVVGDAGAVQRGGQRRHLPGGRRRVAADEPGADRRGGGVASGTSPGGRPPGPTRER